MNKNEKIRLKQVDKKLEKAIELLLNSRIEIRDLLSNKEQIYVEKNVKMDSKFNSNTDIDTHYLFYNPRL